MVRGSIAHDKENIRVLHIMLNGNVCERSDNRKQNRKAKQKQDKILVKLDKVGTDNKNTGKKLDLANIDKSESIT